MKYVKSCFLVQLSETITDLLSAEFSQRVLMYLSMLSTRDGRATPAWRLED